MFTLCLADPAGAAVARAAVDDVRATLGRRISDGLATRTEAVLARHGGDRRSAAGVLVDAGAGRPPGASLARRTDTTWPTS